MNGELLHFVIKVEKYKGGIKMAEVILKEFFAEDIDMNDILGKCNESKELNNTIPLILDEYNKDIEDSIYFGGTYTANI